MPDDVTDQPTELSSDEQLVLAARDGDDQAFALLYQRYASRLLDFCARRLNGDRDTAADAVQETFIAVRQHLPGLQDPDRFRPWLYVIAQRHALRTIRGNRTLTGLDDLQEEPRHNRQDGPEEWAVASEQLVLLQSAMNGLDREDQHLIGLHLRGLHGKDLADAAQAELPVVQVRLHRAKKRLRSAMDTVLLARGGQSTCGSLRQLVAVAEGQLTPLLRKRAGRHIDQCARCSALRRDLTGADVALGVGVLWVGITAVGERIPSVALASAQGGTATPLGALLSAFAPGGSVPWRSLAGGGAAAGLLLLLLSPVGPFFRPDSEAREGSSPSAEQVVDRRSAAGDASSAATPVWRPTEPTGTSGTAPDDADTGVASPVPSDAPGTASGGTGAAPGAPSPGAGGPGAGTGAPPTGPGDAGASDQGPGTDPTPTVPGAADQGPGTDPPPAAVTPPTTTPVLPPSFVGQRGPVIPDLARGNRRDEHPVVMRLDDGTYRMWWSGLGPVQGLFHNDGDRLYASNSTDLVNWSFPGGFRDKAFDQIIMPNDTRGSFPNRDIQAPSVVRGGDGLLYVYYQGIARGGAANPGGQKIGVARGPDGLHNVEHLFGGQPILHAQALVSGGTEVPGGPDGGVMEPSAVFRDGLFYLAYYDSTGTAGPGTYVIRSADPTFQAGVEVLTAEGFAPKTPANATAHLLTPVPGIHLAWVPELGQYAVTGPAGEGGYQTEVAFYSEDLLTKVGSTILPDIPAGTPASFPSQLPTRLDDDGNPLPLFPGMPDYSARLGFRGPGLVTSPEGYLLTSGTNEQGCTVLPLDAFRGIGPDHPNLRDIGYIGTDMLVNCPAE